MNQFDTLTGRLQARINTLQARLDRLANLRLVTVLGLGAATLAAGFLAPPVLFWGLLAITVVTFTVLVLTYRQLAEALERFRAWHLIKTQHAARKRLDWAHIPPGRADPRGPRHAFEQDIDLLDVHRLLDTSISQGGSQRLYSWLLTPHPDPETIRERQILQRETTARFRDRLTLAGALGAEDLQQSASGDTLVEWLHQSDMPRTLPALLAAMAIVAPLNIGLFVGFLSGALPPYWVATTIAYAVLFLLQSPLTLSMFNEAMTLIDWLRRLAAVTSFLEGWSFRKMPRLQALCEPLLSERPSADIRRLSLLAGGAGVQRNPYLWILLNVLMPWDPLIGVLLAQAKAGLAERLPRWLDIWYELEALSALSTFAALNPQAAYPTVSSDGPLFEADALGHPLIPRGVRVRNPFRFEAPGELVIITGSNMAGKSSFLRTLGVNLRLAYAGGPVIAERMALQPMRLFSSIRVSDSLEDGISFFYAEVKRLRALLDAFQAADALPLFFLIDEIFRGTNNRERLIGSQAYIKALVGGNGVGLIATHDLDLVRLAEGERRIRNMHFREQVTKGRMAFDYVLRDGPCPTTNALTIMALEGLPVEPL